MREREREIAVGKISKEYNFSIPFWNASPGLMPRLHEGKGQTLAALSSIADLVYWLATSLHGAATKTDVTSVKRWHQPPTSSKAMRASPCQHACWGLLLGLVLEMLRSRPPILAQ